MRGGDTADQDRADRLRAKVRSIGDHARSVNLQRAGRLAEVLATVDGGRLGGNQRQVATALAHQLVGSAGTFGFAGASQLAAELERFFTDGAFDDQSQVLAAQQQLSQLRKELAAEPVYQADDDDPGLTSD
jgi:HPt (histidine-containing phosphotransfer) domain-containing protein